jgi:sugar-specific transcriptional regulator TrmB
MLLKQELISKIKDYFDLNLYETKVWLALLRKGVASAGEVASISGVPRSRTYDVLESLEKKGFSIVKIGKPVRYIGIKPKIILEKLKNDVKENAKEKITGLSKIEDTEEFEKLERLYQRKGTDIIKRENISIALKGKLNISNYLREILQNAKKEIIICTNVEEMKTKVKLFKQTFKTLKMANIKVKMALSGDDNIIKQMENEFGIKIKQMNIDAKFFIIDRKEILFYLSKNTDKEDFAIWLKSEFFVESFASLFEKGLD